VRPASADRGTSLEAGPPQPRRRWRAGGETQSAGYARRRRPLRGCGRGFDSHRLHWFARDRQSGTCLDDSVISGWIVCDKCDIACRVFPANGADRVAGESQIDASGQSRASRTAVGARDQDTLASVDDCESASSRGRDARVSSPARVSGGQAETPAYLKATVRRYCAAETS
jgi:hypothetical protein